MILFWVLKTIETSTFCVFSVAKVHALQGGYELLYFLSIELERTGENMAWGLYSWALEPASLGSSPASTPRSLCGQISQMRVIVVSRWGCCEN